jgi:hypothetical protein
LNLKKLSPKERKKNRTILVVLFFHPSFTFFPLPSVFSLCDPFVFFFLPNDMCFEFPFCGFLFSSFFLTFLSVCSTLCNRRNQNTNPRLVQPLLDRTCTNHCIVAPIAQSDHLYAQYSPQPLRTCLVTMVLKIMVILWACLAARFILVLI